MKKKKNKLNKSTKVVKILIEGHRLNEETGELENLKYYIKVPGSLK